MINHRLFIPGPLDVSADTFKAMNHYMIGHRSEDFQNLFAKVQKPLKNLFGTQNTVYLSTSSATGIMEASIKNLVRDGKKVLNCCNGAFSDKWFSISQNCGIDSVELKKEWGSPILPEDIDKHLTEGEFDAVTLVHNSTTTGVINPLKEIAKVVKKYPNTLLIVDVVSSLSVIEQQFDEIKADVMLAGSQKALALPPGLTLFTLSQNALQRSKEAKNKGFYFDFLTFEKFAQKNMTPTTPCISTIFALSNKLIEIENEGLENRFLRHKKLKEISNQWVKDNGFDFFVKEEQYRSPSVTCVENNLNVDLAKLKEKMFEAHNIVIDIGYGKLKGKTLRIPHMGDFDEQNFSDILSQISNMIKSL